MAKTAILAVRIISDARGAANGFNQAATGADRFRAGVSGAAKAATGIAAAMVGVGAVSIRAASDAEQAAGAVESVFGNAAGAVKGFAGEAAQTVGLAAADYNQLAAVLGAQLSNLGIAQSEVAGTTNNLIGLGSDLAATFGGTTADAVSALSALFRGEMDPIEKYGVSIKQSDVNARMAAQGLDNLTGNAKRTAETQTKLALVMEQTAGAQGQFARESETVAGQQQRLAAEFENTKAAIGDALLPVLAQVAEKFAGIANWVGQNTGLFWGLVAVVGTLAAIMVTVNAVWTAYTAISGIVAAVKAIETGAWIANAAAVWAATWPILAIIAIIAAVVAVVILVVRNLDTLRGWWDIAFEAGRTAISATWNFLKQLGSWIAGAFMSVVRSIGNVFRTAFDIAKSVVNAMLAPIRAVIDAVRSLISWIGNISFPSPPSWMNPGNWFSSMSAEPRVAARSMGPQLMSAATAPRAIAPMSSPIPSAGALLRSVIPEMKTTNVYIQIDGAIDPVETGRQINRALTSHDRALGNVQAVRLSGRGA